MGETTEKPGLFEALMAVKPDDLSANAWAIKAGVNRNVFADARRRGNLKQDVLEKLLDAAGVGLAEFDAARRPQRETLRSEVAPAAGDVRRSWRADDPGMGPVPRLGSAMGGDFLDEVETHEIYADEILGYINRPPDLEGDAKAYVLYVLGESMAPAIPAGVEVHVSPHSPVRPGDKVIVQLRGPLEDEDDRVRLVLIKEFVRRTNGGALLRQYNPEREIEVPATRIVTDSRGRAAIHRVTGLTF